MRKIIFQLSKRIKIGLEERSKNSMLLKFKKKKLSCPIVLIAGIKTIIILQNYYLY
jgi:hypothetical protein